MNPKLSLKEKLGSVLKRNKSPDDSKDDKPMPDKNDKKSTDNPSALQPVPKAATAAPAVKAPDAEAVKIEKEIANLQEGLGRIESSITKAVTASTSGFEDNIKGLMQKLDDMVIAMQSSQSDRNSPFNSTSLIQELPESVGLKGEEQKPPQQQQGQQSPQGSQSTEKSSGVSDKNPKLNGHDEDSVSGGHSNSLMDSIADVLQQQSGDSLAPRDEEEPMKEVLRSSSSRRLPMISNRLQEFVKSCALLEIVEGDNKRLNYLYDIGVLRTEDLETASRIMDLLGRVLPEPKTGRSCDYSLQH